MLAGLIALEVKRVPMEDPAVSVEPPAVRLEDLVPQPLK